MRMPVALSDLLDSACPSIRYRVREEILGECMTDVESMKFKEEILKDRLVKEVLGWRKCDGWLGEELHHEKGPETGIRILMEKGLRRHPVVGDALHALTSRGDSFDDGCLSNVGKALDRHRLGGSKMILATVFAYAGVEDVSLVRGQIEEALQGFRFLLGVSSLEDVVRPHKKWLVFREGVSWPSLYHLRLLAYTRVWRTDENIKMLAGAVTKLVSLSPIPQVHLLHKSQIMAPASVFMHDFCPDMKNMKPLEWLGWFHRMEMLSRLGVVSLVSQLARQVEEMNSEFLDGHGHFSLKIAHRSFRRWSPYTGLALEPDWKTNRKSRTWDLTFRCALINHYRGVG